MNAADERAELALASKKFAKRAGFVHGVSGVNILKSQHTDYETRKNGPRDTAGVTCIYCHMPCQREDGKKFSGHWRTLPLNDAELRAWTGR